jgi:hypothetical protein
MVRTIVSERESDLIVSLLRRKVTAAGDARINFAVAKLALLREVLLWSFYYSR